jgi:hypothetical protein
MIWNGANWVRSGTSDGGNQPRAIVAVNTINDIPTTQGVYQLPDGSLYSVDSFGFKKRLSNYTNIGNTIILHGDSYENNSSIQTSGAITQYLQTGYFWFANVLMDNYFTQQINSGVAGENASQIRARIATIITANPSANTILIGAGTNAPASYATSATIAAQSVADDILYMCKYATQKGLSVILRTIPPRSSTASDAVIYSSYRVKLNPLIRNIAALNGYILFDIEAATMDPATGYFYEAGVGGFVNKLYTTTSPTGVHLNGSGGLVAGRELSKTLKNILFNKPLYSKNNTYPGRNLLTTGTMLGTAGTTTGLSGGSVLPTGWSVSGAVTMPAGGTTVGTITTSKVTSPDLVIPGDALQISIVEGTGAGLAPGIVTLIAQITGFTIGSKLSGSIYVEIDALNFGGTQLSRNSVNVFINCVTSGFANLGSARVYADDATDGNKEYFSGGIFNLPDKNFDGTDFVIPATTAYIFCTIVVVGIGTFRFMNFVAG